MQSEEFLRKVMDRAHLEELESAGQAVHAVFAALRSRISHAGGDNMASQLPKHVRELWESSLTDHIIRSFRGVDRMNRRKFLERVRESASLADIAAAETVVWAVFQTLREQITNGAQHAIEAQLPNDLKELWLGAGRGTYGSDVIGPSVVEVFRSDEQIEHEVEELLDASDEVDAQKINVAVQQGTVTLSGKVKTDHEREAAACIARDALGTTEVINEIKIQQPRRPKSHQPPAES